MKMLLKFLPVLALALGASACNVNPQTAHEAEQITSDVLSASQVLCVLAADFASGVPGVLTVCNLDEKYAPAVEQLLAQAQKIGVGKVPVGGCKK